MNNDRYRDLLADMIMEINEVALDSSNGDSSEFDRGYRAGMMVIMKAIQDELKSFEINDHDIRLIDVDEWFRLGKNYNF